MVRVKAIIYKKQSGNSTIEVDMGEFKSRLHAFRAIRRVRAVCDPHFEEERDIYYPLHRLKHFEIEET